MRKNRRNRDDDDPDDEDHLYGTPFPPIDETNQINSKKKQELDQTVRDEKGRRRFHGAFTGGYSAGYWNSVGSKEGWTPSQFISRKNDRSQVQKYKPENYMDEDDFSEFGIAPKQVKAKEQFFSTAESFAGFRENLNNNQKLSSIDEVLKDVVSLKSVSIGIKILKKMKKNAIQKLSKDNYMNSDKIFPLEFDESDLKNFFLNTKKNLNGLGYKGLKSNLNFLADPQEQSKSEFNTVMKDGKKLKISGEAFGYGALDEDDDFETEIYTFDDLSKYDYTLGGKQVKSSGHLSNSILNDTHLMDDFHKSKEHSLDRINENKNIINIPANWHPKPPICTTIVKKRKSRWNDQDEKDKKDKNNEQDKFKKLNAFGRSEILGDENSLEKEDLEIKLKKIKEDTELKLNKIKEEEKKIPEKEIEIDEKKFKKPLTGFFAHKFTLSTNTSINDDELKPGLNKIENLPQASKSKEESLKEETKSFVGKSDREIYQWHPHKLICKRFNVPHPYPQFSEVVGVLAINKTKQTSSIMGSISITPIHSSSKNKSAPQIKEPEVIEEFEKPDMNLFKAVFDISDDEDNSIDIDEIEIEEIEKDEKKPNEDTYLKGNNLKDNCSNEDQIKLKEEKFVDEIKNSAEQPRIVFNKSFVKKDSAKEIKQPEAEKKNLKISLNLFENDDIDLESDEEGVNLLDLKNKKTTNLEEEVYFKKVNKVMYKKEDKIDEQRVETDKPTDKIIEKICNKTVNEKDYIVIDKSDDSGSDSDDCLDDFVNEILKPESNLKSHSGSSRHKKKRKKNKDHKKHKKKKHKSKKYDSN